MAFIMDCNKCPLRINTSAGLFVVCAGPCAKAFHITCVGLKKDHLCSLSSNVLWFCEECLNRFREWKSITSPAVPVKEPELQTVNREIADLKNQVAEILHTLKTIKPNTPSSDYTVHHSTPISSSNLSNGTNVDSACWDVNNSIQPEQNNERMRGASETNFSLFMTNIDSRVSEKEIKTMVSQCLGAPETECREVKKLVSKWMNCNATDNASFKVVIDGKWKEMAVKASTWPQGVKYREFVDRPINRWRPNH